jgi:hypothetical protein
MPCSVEDILRTRLTTLGVEEHRLTLEGGQIEQRNREWIIYDVGGSRTQRGKYNARSISGSLCHYVRSLSRLGPVL